MDDRTDAPRRLPSVDRLLRDFAGSGLPRGMLVDVIRREVDRARTAGEVDVRAAIERAVVDRRRTRLGPVINATGILVHTNLGRSPMGDRVSHAVAEAASLYSNLEFDLATGERGGRAAYVEHGLALLCEAEATTVVNNCAAALVLILRHLASREPRTHVVISRGELVQIGGGFRVPEILEASGATLREVGTTNQTALDDYRRAIDARTAMVLRVHRGNFFVGGFVGEPASRELAALAREMNVPFVEDLGSGATFDTRDVGDGVEREPTPARAIDAGADLVCFSGDKLLGGPQAGVIAGRATLVAGLKREPFYRALRCEKLVLAALQATVDVLLDGDGDRVPVRRMMSDSIDALRARAHAIIDDVGLSTTLALSVGDSVAQVGGGTMPRTQIASIAIDVRSPSRPPQSIAASLRLAPTPIVGYVADGRVRLDLRAVFDPQDKAIADALRRLAGAVTI